MNIGLLSFQRMINHGSFLQAYALKHMLEDIGHNVAFIDVRLEGGGYLNVNNAYEIESPFKERLRRLFRPLIKGRGYAYEIEKARRFRAYFRLLGLPEAACTNTKYDAVVIGSDEVFSLAQSRVWGGTLQLFGEGLQTDCLLSYGASFGYTTYETLQEMNMAQSVAALLARFKAISVRDRHTADTVEKLTGRRPELHSDPVLVYHFSDVPRIARDKRYVLIYSYTNRLCEPEYIGVIRRFAKKHGLKTVAAGGYLDWCSRNVQADPFELLAYVRQADYVVSETFHGVVYAIKYQKQFVAIVRDSNRNKVAGLLELFGLTDRIAAGDNPIDQILCRPYDRDGVRRTLRKETADACRYLSENLPNRTPQ